ncbi:MAG TPA: monomethylamine:corrinoid methyltransferase, partial [Methanomassiliicoccales archaeon]|nr:monomethylamine:corrinoid methyltransferase [Methanomassiliicoccales archaeon]
MLDTASGRELVSGCAVAKGVSEDYTTGMEARMMGEVSRAIAGKDVYDVNVMLDKIVKGYERHYLTAPQGRTFQECYNVRKITPTKEYVEVYEQACNNLRKFGLDLF